jgi:hypothetical protein
MGTVGVASVDFSANGFFEFGIGRQRGGAGCVGIQPIL